MESAARSRLALLPLPSAAPLDDPLPLEERGLYQHQLLEDFLVSRRSTVTASTVQGSLSALRANFFPWLEATGRYVWEVTPDDLDRWALTLKHSVRTRTHQQYFIQVEQFYEWLITRRGTEIQARLGVEVRNPVDRFNRARRMPEGERLVPVPREEAIDFFLAATRSAISTAGSDVKWLQACRNYTLWMLLNWAGLRRVEAAELVRDDVDLVACTLRIREGRGGKGRIVHIQPPLAPVLRWYRHDVRPQALASGRRLSRIWSTALGVTACSWRATLGCPSMGPVSTCARSALPHPGR